MAALIRSVDDLGNLVRTRRKELGFTQRRVADLCGTGLRFISDFENGKETLKIGKALIILMTLGIDLKAEIRGAS